MEVRERLDVLDGLRGIAILLVVWYHVALVSGQGFGPLNFIAQAGFLGVDLFFFISGFCLFYPYACAQIEGRPAPSTRRFFSRRLLKIVPSYVLALLVFALVYRAQFASPQDAALQVFTHLAFMHTLFPATYGTISGPLWTIGVEVQFYLLFPLLVPFFRRSPVACYLALVAISEIYRFAIGSLGLGAQFGWINQLPAFFDVFGAGMFAAYALVALRARPLWPPRTATLLSGGAFAYALAGLALASWVGATSSVDAAHMWLNTVRVFFGPLCIAVTLTTFFAAAGWKALVASPVLVFLSAISYNLYLWHLELAVWLSRSGLPSIVATLLSIPISVGVATLLTYRLEQPILRADIPRIIAAARARLRNRLPLPNDVLEHAA